MRRPLLGALLLWCAACAPEPLTDLTVNNVVNNDTNNVTNNAEQVKFSQVADIMRASCSKIDSCHGASGFAPPRIQGSGMATDEQVRAALEDMMSESMAGKRLIEPGDVDNSILYRRMTDARFGSIMPLGGMKLPDEQLMLIETWIEQGASYSDAPTDQDMGGADDMGAGDMIGGD